MIVAELWSAADEARAEACAAAAHGGDLVSALFALEAVPAEVDAEDRATLDAWGARLVALAGEASPSAQARGLARLLGEELGFRGDADDYYQAQNSHLHRVIARRRGMPILLSVVWMEVGTRGGLRVEGVGLPGHFIVRVGGHALADPFRGGAPLEVEDCKRLVRETSQGKLAWRDDYLAPSPPRQIVERVLQNLVNAAARPGEAEAPGAKRPDVEALFRALGFLVKLRPDVPRYLLERGIAADAVGARSFAQDTFAEVVKTHPGSPEARIAAERRRRGAASRLLN